MPDPRPDPAKKYYADQQVNQINQERFDRINPFKGLFSGKAVGQKKEKINGDAVRTFAKLLRDDPQECVNWYEENRDKLDLPPLHLMKRMAAQAKDPETGKQIIKEEDAELIDLNDIQPTPKQKTAAKSMYPGMK